MLAFQKKGTNQLADHALVFMLVPLLESWVQPTATFATKGAAPGKILAVLVLEAVLQLHKYGATVIAVISDGTGNNRSMWQQLGVRGICGVTMPQGAASLSTRREVPAFHV